MKKTIESIKTGQPAEYQIVVQGRLKDGWSEWFDGLAVEVKQTTGGRAITTLTGTVLDQSALHGLLNRIRDLSIPLLSVQLINSSIPNANAKNFSK